MTEHILTGVGAELKQTREAAGLAIGDVAHRLKMLPRQIESLEHERFDRLPGPAIARTMVRNYARLLNLDPQPLEERMAPRREEPDTDAAQQRERAPSTTARRRSTVRYVGFAVVLAAVVGVLAYESSRKPSPPAPLAAAPEPVAPVVPARPAPPVVHHAPAKAPEAKLPEASAAAEKLEVASAQAPAVDTPKAEPSAERAVAPPGTRRLVLRMEQEAWLEVRDGAGRGLVSSLNPAGTERSVRGQPPFQLVIGNAAHVRLTYNGKPVDLGPYIKDQVARLTLQ